MARIKRLLKRTTALFGRIMWEFHIGNIVLNVRVAAS